MSRTRLYLFGMSALTGALVIGSSLQGCRGDSGTPGFGGSVGSGASAASSTTKSTSATSGNGGGVPALDRTIQQITNPSDPAFVTNAYVRLTGVIATSVKFEVSKSKSSGSCLWGLFVSAPGLTTTAPNTGILVVNDGTPATASGDAGEVYCPVPQAGMPAGDMFPDDTAPGDVFDIVGEASSYVPSTCGAPDAAPPDNSNVPQYQITKVTSAKRTSRGAKLPTPAVLTSAEVAAIAGGTDTKTLGQWGGVRVTVQNVTAVLQEGMTFDSYGHMLMDDGLQVGDKLYYVGYLKTTDACYNGPAFPVYTPHFDSITGLVYLDYCTWGLSPSSKCTDLTPPSEDCLTPADWDAGGTDAGDPCTTGPDAGSNGATCCY